MRKAKEECQLRVENVDLLIWPVKLNKLCQFMKITFATVVRPRLYLAHVSIVPFVKIMTCVRNAIDKSITSISWSRSTDAQKANNSKE